MQKMRNRIAPTWQNLREYEVLTMRTTRVLFAGAAAAAIAAALTGLPVDMSAVQPPAARVNLDADDIGGVVTGRAGTRSRRLGDRRDDATCRRSS